MKPDVSIIIPTYNRAKMLAGAIDSCRQTGNDISVEVIVVDDGSTDDTEAVVSALNVRYIRQPRNMGRCSARNEGEPLETVVACFSLVAQTTELCHFGTCPSYSLGVWLISPLLV